MGEVYRARDPRLGRDVAIKILPPTVSDDPRRLRRFDQEARALAALNHPNILAVYDLGVSDGRSYVVSELLVGQTLREAISRGALPVRTAVDYGIQIATGLTAAHQRGIIHRDLKPENLFVAPDGRVKILDFGLAKVIEVDHNDSSMATAETRDGNTEPGTVSGTIGYMSPEQMRGLPVDRRTDLFSFGIVLYEMVTGSRPFRGGSSTAVADAILHEPPQDFGDRVVPGALRSTILRLLEKDPAKRYAGAEQVQEALVRLNTSPRPARPFRLSVSAGLAVALVVATAAVAGGWFRLETEQYVEATALMRDARAVIPNDARLDALWILATGEVSVATVPPGAEVSVHPLHGDPGDRQIVGATPLDHVRVPKADYVWRIAKPGFAPIALLERAPLSRNLKLWPSESVP